MGVHKQGLLIRTVRRKLFSMAQNPEEQAKRTWLHSLIEGYWFADNIHLPILSTKYKCNRAMYILLIFIHDYIDGRLTSIICISLVTGIWFLSQSFCILFSCYSYNHNTRYFLNVYSAAVNYDELVIPVLPTSGDSFIPHCTTPLSISEGAKRGFF